MTKKKKTLRAAVLASIFAMSICGWSNTVWAEVYGISLDQATAPGATNTWRGKEMPNYTEYDEVAGNYYAYNPTLKSNDGTADNNGTGNYEPKFNYYLQAFAYGPNSINACELYVERIVGVKMNEGGEATQDLNQFGIENKIDVSGVQFFHVEYGETGNVVSPDGLDVADGYISLAEQIHKEDDAGNKLYIDKITGEQTTNQYDDSSGQENAKVLDTVMHYCGESAKSISIGQLQRMNEVFYANDLNLSEGIEDEAQLRWEADQRIDVSYNETTNELTWTPGAMVQQKNDAGKELYYYFDETGNKHSDVTANVSGNDTNGWKVTIGTGDDAKVYDAYKQMVYEDSVTWTLNQLEESTNGLTIGQDGDNKGKLIMSVTDAAGKTVSGVVDVGAAGITYGGQQTTIQEAVNSLSQGWTAKVNGQYVNQVTPGDQQNFVSGKNITVSNPKDTYNIQVSLNDNIEGLTSITSQTVTATTSVTTPTLILQDGNSTTNLKWNSTTNRIEYGPEESKQQIATLDDGMKYGADNTNGSENLIDLNLNGQLNILGGKNITTESDGIDGITVKLDDEVKGLTLVESTTVEAITVKTTDINVSNQIKVGDKVTITEDGMNINNKVVVEENKVDVGGNKIENVADGEISKDSKDAVNGGQLYQEQQERIAGDNMLSNRLDKLGNRVDKVGAGAAALAALHPLDFDPDDKLSFSAGVGNYGGETATALGMFYRPTEKVMLSAAGTMGNGENMVNMGVTFALDKTNNVSNSRVAMAREIQDLREQVAALTALVTQLAGRSNPALQDVVMFPDVPENHWAYDYIEGLQKRGIVEGYPDGNFAGDRSMTRYEYAAMLYRALEKGFPVDSRLLDEFDAELGRIRVDRIKGLDDDANKVERVRVNQYEDRDDYGSKLIAVNAVKQ